MAWFDAIVSWSDTHEGFASWVQAVGTLLALLIAIGVPAWQHHADRRAEREDRRIRARSLAIALWPELMELRAQIRRAREVLEPMPGHMIADKLLPPLREAAVDIPPVIWNSVDKLHLLANHGGLEIQQLLALLSQYERMYDRVMRRAQASAPITAFRGTAASLLPHLVAASKQLDEAERALVPLHDGTPLEAPEAG